MAAKAGPILGLFAKWLVVPIGLGLIGFYVIGPRLSTTQEPVDTSAPSNPLTEPTKKFVGEPQVKVEVSKPIRKSSFKKRRKKDTPKDETSTPTPSEQQFPESVPPLDGG